MKKIITLIAFIILISGCQNVVFEIIDQATISGLRGQNLYDPGNFPEMETFEDVANYIMSVLDYDSYMNPLDPIMDPQKAIATGKGNCTTFALLFMNVAHFTLGIDFDFADADSSGSLQKTVGVGGIPTHSIVMLDGQLYSAYTGRPINDYDAAYYYSFDEVFIQ